MMTRLPDEAADLSRVQFFRSLDDQISINVFEYGEQERFGTGATDGGGLAAETEAMKALLVYCQVN